MNEDAAAERTIAGVTVRIDRLLCVGFGDCIELAPQLFEFDGEGVACFRQALDQVERRVIIDACRSCPVDALTAFADDGTPLAP